MLRGQQWTSQLSLQAESAGGGGGRPVGAAAAQAAARLHERGQRRDRGLVGRAWWVADGVATSWHMRNVCMLHQSCRQ